MRKNEGFSLSENYGAKVRNDGKNEKGKGG